MEGAGALMLNTQEAIQRTIRLRIIYELFQYKPVLPLLPLLYLLSTYFYLTLIVYAMSWL